jgi:hypothetical protein
LASFSLAEPVIEIYRRSQGVKVDLAELVEAARVGATTPQARRLWVDAMVTLIRGWVSGRLDPL